MNGTAQTYICVFASFLPQSNLQRKTAVSLLSATYPLAALENVGFTPGCILYTLKTCREF